MDAAGGGGRSAPIAPLDRYDRERVVRSRAGAPGFNASDAGAEGKADVLLTQMTVKEKVGQLIHLFRRHAFINLPPKDDDRLSRRVLAVNGSKPRAIPP
nr:hypothetical protein TQ38_28440 [Novosphingobium sp. P6W]